MIDAGFDVMFKLDVVFAPGFDELIGLPMELRGFRVK